MINRKGVSTAGAAGTDLNGTVFPKHGEVDRRFRGVFVGNTLF